MRRRSGQVPTAAIIVVSIFAVMFIGTVTFFVYQFQKGSSKTNKNTTVVTKNNNKNKNANTGNTTNTAANQNTNASVGVDIAPSESIPETWKTYTNGLANYSIRYPDTWTLQEVSIADHPVQKIAVRYVKFLNPNGQVTLSLGVRRVGDTYGINERTAAPTGTLSTGITFRIAAIDVNSSNLVVDSAVPAIFYYPLKPFGYTYLEGREVQAELAITAVPGVAKPVTDLLKSNETQVANTILSSLAFTDISTPVTQPPVSAVPLGQFKIESYRPAPGELADTRLINLDGGKRTVEIESTRTRAGLASGHALTMVVFPAFGTTLYLQDQELKTGTVGGALWTYDVTSKRLTKQSTYPEIGWGKVAVNKVRTRAVYTSSTVRDDSGDVKVLYYLDLVQNSLASLVTLVDNRTFSSGWGGSTNTFLFSFKTDDTVKYTFYDQNSGNKQSKMQKTKLGEGQIVVPGANPATQK